MRDRLAGEDTSGTKIVAGMPSRDAAKATAAPWLPPDAATTPAAGAGRSRRLANAPLALNDPECWRNSSFSTSGPPGRSSSDRSMRSTGVVRTESRQELGDRLGAGRSLEELG